MLRDEARQSIEGLHLGTKLKHCRKEVRHWTLQEVAERTGLSKPLISQIENNLVTPPLQTLYLICKALDVSVMELLKDLDGQPEMDSRATAESALKQMEVSLAQLKAFFKELPPPKKERPKVIRSRRRSATKTRKRK